MPKNIMQQKRERETVKEEEAHSFLDGWLVLLGCSDGNSGQVESMALVEASVTALASSEFLGLESGKNWCLKN